MNDKFYVDCPDNYRKGIFRNTLFNEGIEVLSVEENEFTRIARLFFKNKEDYEKAQVLYNLIIQRETMDHLNSLKPDNIDAYFNKIKSKAVRLDVLIDLVDRELSKINKEMPEEHKIVVGGGDEEAAYLLGRREAFEKIKISLAL